MPKYLSSTQVLAFYGAIASTVAIVLHIIRAMKDRGRLGIAADVRASEGSDRLRLFVTITNKGRRSVSVRALGVRIKGESYTLPPINVPNNILNEGEHFTQFIDGLPNLDIAEIYALDSSDKKWKLSRRHLKKLIRDAARIEW